jgi:TolB-like protein/Flp pilus assembly protein TadD
MAEERVQRRLAAILAADVVGYSRLMEQDEAGTLAALKERRKGILQPLVTEHDGRIIKVMGDGVLAEFGSAVNAVACAAELQKRMATENDGVADDRSILRIGINLGDVVVEGNDLYGDGVIIAVRLQAMAEPGGICLAGNVQEQIGSKLPLKFEDLGPCEVKNIAKPIRVFQVRFARQEPKAAASQSAAQAKPSIAILPFTNMSGDPEHAYFSDGITEDIITELSRFRSLLVIARNSSFQFRGAASDVKTIGRQLGVLYVVEGGVRKLADHVRITAQLIDVATSHHLWAERYDRVLEDIFAVQGEVACAIAGTLEGRVAVSGAASARRKPTQQWGAYDYFLRGRQCVVEYDVEGAEPLLHRAIAMDPDYAQAHAWQSFVHIMRYFEEGQPETLDQALRLAQRAVLLDTEDAQCHVALGLTYMIMRRFDVAGVNLDRAITLNPTDTLGTRARAGWLAHMGRAGEALRSLETDLLRDPFPPTLHWEFRGIAFFQAHRYNEAIDSFNEISRLRWWHHCYLAACYGHLEIAEGARRHAAEMLRQRPDFSVGDVERTEPFRDPADLENLMDGLRKAGLLD